MASINSQQSTQNGWSSGPVADTGDFGNNDIGMPSGDNDGSLAKDDSVSKPMNVKTRNNMPMTITPGSTPGQVTISSPGCDPVTVNMTINKTGGSGVPYIATFTDRDGNQVSAAIDKKGTLQTNSWQLGAFHPSGASSSAPYKPSTPSPQQMQMQQQLNQQAIDAANGK